jgi:nucleoside phosphorylase
MNKTILLVFAMEEELQAMLDQLPQPIQSHATYLECAVKDTRVLLLLTGVTMLKTYQLYPMLLLEKVDEVIQVGTCAGLKQQPIGTVIHAKTFFNHDLDLTAFGRPQGWLWKEQVQVIKPVLVSGSKFLSSKVEAEKVVALYDADGFDMESFGFYTICRDQNIPFSSIRAVSDNGEHHANKTFEDHLRFASTQAASYTLTYLLNKTS